MGGIAGLLTAMWAVPAAEAERGYSAYGGKWVLIFAAAFITILVIRQIRKGKIKMPRWNWHSIRGKKI